MNLSREKTSLGNRSRQFHFTGVTSYQPEESRDRHVIRWAIGLAVAFHALLFLVQLPETEATPEIPGGSSRPVYVVQQVRFEPPPMAARQPPPKPKERRIPIPDPTPDEPEPIRVEEELNLDLDFGDSDVDSLLADLPAGPPGMAGGATGSPGPIAEVGGDVLAPRRLHFPQPKYTEDARAARIQGVVLLRVVIDPQGNVIRPEVLKGLPMGLTESAVETVKTWKYEPATRHGKPVAVYMVLTINFGLQ